MIKFNEFKRLKTEGISYEKSLKKNMCGWKSTGVGIGAWDCGGIRVGYGHFCLFNIYSLLLNLDSSIGHV